MRIGNKVFNMFNLEKFIADSVTNRPVSMFAADIEAINRERIRTLYGQEQEPADPELKKKRV